MNGTIWFLMLFDVGSYDTGGKIRIKDNKWPTRCLDTHAVTTQFVINVKKPWKLILADIYKPQFMDLTIDEGHILMFLLYEPLRVGDSPVLKLGVLAKPQLCNKPTHGNQSSVRLQAPTSPLSIIKNGT